MSSCLNADQPISGSDLAVLMNDSPSVQQTEEDKSDIMLTISIISGIPGSYKENVANYITQLTQERSRYNTNTQQKGLCLFFNVKFLWADNSFMWFFS